MSCNGLNYQLKAIFAFMNLEFNKNDDAMRLAVSQMKQRHAVISMGGGKKAMDKAREKGKMSPRERIQYLVEKGILFKELGALAGYEMYKGHGGCPFSCKNPPFVNEV